MSTLKYPIPLPSLLPTPDLTCIRLFLERSLHSGQNQDQNNIQKTFDIKREMKTNTNYLCTHCMNKDEESFFKYSTTFLKV